MKQNKWIALGLAAALSLGLFAGCAKEEEKQDGQQPQDEKTENQKVKEITDKLEETGYKGYGAEIRTRLILAK